MQYAQASFSNLPLVLILIPEGKRIAVTKLTPTIDPVLDSWGDLQVLFDSAGYVVINSEGESMPYNYDATYEVDNHPTLVEWLKRQHLQLGPVIFEQRGFA